MSTVSKKILAATSALLLASPFAMSAIQAQEAPPAPEPTAEPTPTPSPTPTEEPAPAPQGDSQ